MMFLAASGRLLHKLDKNTVAVNAEIKFRARPPGVRTDYINYTSNKVQEFEAHSQTDRALVSSSNVCRNES